MKRVIVITISGVTYAVSNVATPALSDDWQDSVRHDPVPIQLTATSSAVGAIEGDAGPQNQITNEQIVSPARDPQLWKIPYRKPPRR
jgi:hypothetical protein